MNRAAVPIAVMLLCTAAASLSQELPSSIPEWVLMPEMQDAIASTQCINAILPEEISITLALVDIARQIEISVVQKVGKGRTTATDAVPPYTASKSMTQQTLGSLVAVSALDKLHSDTTGSSIESVAKVTYGSENLREVQTFQRLTETAVTDNYESRFSINREKATSSEIKHLLVKSPSFVLRTELVSYEQRDSELCSQIGYLEG